MADALRRASPRRVAAAPRGGDGAGALPALLLAFPAAVGAAAATLVAGGGVLGALAAYALGGAGALVAGAVVLAAPWRRWTEPARRFAARLAHAAAAPAQFIWR